MSRLAEALPSGAARRPVLLLALGAFALGTDTFVISGVLDDVGRDLGVSLAATGLLVTMFAGAYAVGAPVLAVATGGMCRRRLLLIALSAFTAANVLAALAPSYAVMIVARVLAALAAGLYMPTASATAAALAPEAERGRALAAVLGGLTLATAIGVPAGTLVGHATGWRGTFVLVAALGALALAGLAHSLRSIPSPGVASLRERAAVATRPGIPLMLMTTTLYIGGVFVLYTYLAWFAGHVAGIHGAAVTLVYLVFGLAAVVSSVLGGWLIDHHAPERVAAWSIGGVALAFGTLALVAGLEPVPAAGVCALVAAWSLVGWWYAPAQQARLLAVAGAQGPVALSLNASALAAGQALAGAAGAALLAGGPALLSGGAAAFELAALGVLVATTRGAGAGTLAACRP